MRGLTSELICGRQTAQPAGERQVERGAGRHSDGREAQALASASLIVMYRGGCQRLHDDCSNQRRYQDAAYTDGDCEYPPKQRPGGEVSVADRQSRHERKIDRLLQGPSFEQAGRHGKCDDQREKARHWPDDTQALLEVPPRSFVEVREDPCTLDSCALEKDLTIAHASLSWPGPVVESPGLPRRRTRTSEIPLCLRTRIDTAVKFEL